MNHETNLADHSAAHQLNRAQWLLRDIKAVNRQLMRANDDTEIEQLMAQRVELVASFNRLERWARVAAETDGKTAAKRLVNSHAFTKDEDEDRLMAFVEKRGDVP